ncbi:LamG-like jellyroll fold domain-containing protein, partial [Planctomycetota bacterium]
HANLDSTDRVGISYEGSPDSSVPFFIMPKNEWVHLTFTFDEINATAYLNGIDEEGPKPFSIGPNVNAMVELGYTSTRSGTANRTFHGTLDEIRVYDRPLSDQEIQTVMVGGEIESGAAALPKPGNRAIDVPQDAALSWMRGDDAVTHDVYFGTVFDDVNDASRDNDPQSVLVSQNQPGTTYELPELLTFGQTYYWRVDEFNDLNPESPWKGNVWSFVVINYSIVDDFESYNDLDPTDPDSNRIFNSWTDGYEQPTNGALVGYADPPFCEQTVVHGDKQSLPLFYGNSGPANYSEAQRIFSSGQDWTREGVETLSLWFRGNRPYVGSFVEEPAGTYTMTASGTDIWSTADEFHFAFKETNGGARMIAKVVSVENTHEFTKAGVMIRDTLDGDSAYAAVLVTPGQGVRFQYRKTAGATTSRLFKEGIVAPQWVRLERTSGGLIRAFYSANGKNWEQFNLQQVAMTMPVYIGLAVTSHNAELTCEAKFSNVNFLDTKVDPQWIDQDVGMLSNEPESMYVTVGDGSGTTVTVYHANPSASLIGDWTEWNINTKEFGDAGVVLTDVSKLAIGFGGADNPQPGGSGLVYLDDIRLYLPR